MDKAEQPTITQADRDATVEFAKGLYGKREGEILTKRMVEIFASHFARHRTTSLAAQDGLVGLLRESLVKLQDAQGAHVPKHYACNLIKRIDAALSAIKEQHHD